MTLFLNVKNIIFITIIGSMISCHSVKKADDLYIISKQHQTMESNKQVDSTIKMDAPVSEEFYYQYNFIIDTSNFTYFFAFEIKSKGIDPDYTAKDMEKPPFVNLKPSRLIAVPNSILEEFIKANVIQVAKHGKISINISSPIDTLYQSSFKTLYNYIKNNSKYIHSNIRLLTEEERNVLYCKKLGIEYSPEDFVWITEFRRGFKPTFDEK